MPLGMACAFPGQKALDGMKSRYSGAGGHLLGGVDM